MKLAALALLAGLSVFSCKKVQQEIEDPQPEVVQNTGNIELKVQNSITFAGNGGSSRKPMPNGSISNLKTGLLPAKPFLSK